MASLPQITPISASTFSGKNWRRVESYGFAARETLIPVVASELIQAVPAMPLAFVKSGESYRLVAVTGLQWGNNLFVSPDGRWLGGYVPAVLRSYPFVLMRFKDHEGEKGVLCIDEGSGLVVEAGQGEPFFDQDNQLSRPLQDVKEFLSQVERSRMATQAAVDGLAAAGLIQPWKLTVTQDDKKVDVMGLHLVDEVKLNEMDDAAFLSLRTTGALGVAYAQLLSMNQMSVLRNRVRQS